MLQTSTECGAQMCSTARTRSPYQMSAQFYIYLIRFYMFRPRISAIFRELQDFSTYTAYLASYIYVSGRLYLSV
jgi:NADH:ubiquinone oxidoreductase subunit 3 (subunit A)